MDTSYETRERISKLCIKYHIDMTEDKKSITLRPPKKKTQKVLDDMDFIKAHTQEIIAYLTDLDNLLEWLQAGMPN